MCGIVGYVGDKSALDVVIDGLRRLEYRGYDSAGVALVAGGELSAEKRAGKLANLDKALADGRACHSPRRASATPGGPPTAPRTTATPTRTSGGAAGSRSCTTASSRTSPRCAPSSRRAGHELALRHRHRGGGAPDRERGCRRGRSDDRDAAACAAGSRARSRWSRRQCRQPDTRGRRPPQLAARRRARRGRELPRLRRRGVHRAHPRGDGARPGPGRHDHPRRCPRSPTSTASRPTARRSTSTGTSPRPRRPATTTSCSRRSPSSRRRSPTRLLGRFTDDGRLAARRDAALRRRAARDRQDHHHRVRHRVPRRTGGEVRDRALDPDPLRGRAGVGVPLPRPDHRPRHDGDRDQPERRDDGHPDGAAARPRAAGQGAGDLQHQRLDDPARVRRRALHPRRARRSRSRRRRRS